MLPFLAEPEALVPQDSTTGILDIENRHDLLVHEGEPKRIGPSRTESVPFVETRRVRKGLTPDDLGDLLELPLVAVLATYRRDGTVLLSPVWHEWRDNGFNVVTGPRDVKAGTSVEIRARASSFARMALRYRGLELRARAGLSMPEDQSILRRIATHYLGPEAGDRYAETAADNLLIRLERA